MKYITKDDSHLFANSKIDNKSYSLRPAMIFTYIWPCAA